MEVTELFGLNIIKLCMISGSHSSGYEELYILGYNDKSPIETQ
jgi:hypothetical protein